MDLTKILAAAAKLNSLFTNPEVIAELKSLHDACGDAKTAVDKLAVGAAPGTVNPTLLAVARGNAAAAITAAQNAGAALANVTKFVQGHLDAHPAPDGGTGNLPVPAGDTPAVPPAAPLAPGKLPAAKGGSPVPPKT